MSQNRLFLLPISLILAISCSTPKDSAIPLDELDPKTQTLDKIGREQDWVIPAGEGRGEKIYDWSLSHQKIWIRFDFEKERVLGETELLLRSRKDSVMSVEIDAKLMDFKDIEILSPELSFTLEYDGKQAILMLEEPQMKSDTAIVRIAYEANPPDQLGLDFVDPKGIDPWLPTQIWTLGQPEDNSYWLPTLDAPDQRTTHELWISIPDSLTSVSNGKKLNSSIYSGDSLKTDYWYMDKPSTPYLIAFAIGKFSKSTELVNSTILEYYSEPQFQHLHQQMYRMTSPTLLFFEEKTGVSYPWLVYRQVPVHQFAAGGMENTSVSILSDYVQGDSSSIQAYDTDALIIHELAHQWMGDLVTVKDWKDLALHEGFANFSEYEVMEELRGKSEGQFMAYQNRLDYLQEAKRIRHPIQFTNYEDPYDLYDNHTYDKAALVLRMLKHEIGDSLFWEAVGRFLEEYAYGSVTFEDFQHSFEKITKTELDWFFDQWYRSPGHPEIKVIHQKDVESHSVRLVQTQDISRQPIFQLRLDVQLLYNNGSSKSVKIRFTNADSTYVFNYDPQFESIVDVILDPEQLALVDWSEELDKTQIQLRLEHDQATVRYRTLDNLTIEEFRPAIQDIVKRIAKSDTFWANRKLALELLSLAWTPEIGRWAQQFVADRESRQEVRMFALYNVLPDSSKGADEWLKYMLNDPSYFIAAESFKEITKRNKENSDSLLIEFFNRTDTYQDIFRLAAMQACEWIRTPTADSLLINVITTESEHNLVSTALSAAVRKAHRYKRQKDKFWNAVRTMAESSRLQNQRLMYLSGLFEMDRDLALSYFRERLSTDEELSDPEKMLLDDYLEGAADE